MDKNQIIDDKILLGAMRGVMEETIKENNTDYVRRKKMYVTAPAHNDATGKSVITVQEAFGEEFEVPYEPTLYNVTAGESVWVEWVYGLGNACAVNNGAWRNTVIVTNENGITLDLNQLTVSGHLEGDVVNTQIGTSLTVNGKIQDTINSLGKHLTGDVIITVPAGEYTEDVSILGFCGNGLLKLIFEAGASIIGDWTISGNKRVALEGSSDETNSTQFIGVLEDGVIDICATDYIKITGISVHGVVRESGDDGQIYGIVVRDGSYAYLYGDMIDRTGTAVYVEHAHLDIRNCTGGTASTDETTVSNLVNGIVISTDGGYVNASGRIPMGPDADGTGYESNGYPFTCSGTVVPTESGNAPPAASTTVTTTWTSSAGYYCSSYKTGDGSYESRGTGWKGDGTYNLRMGYNSSTQKYMAGIWLFADAATIQNTLSGATIVKATLSITRTGANGATSGTVIKPYYHSITPSTIASYSVRCDPWAIVNGSPDQYVDCGCDAQYIAMGATGTFELPSSIYGKLQDGTITGFGLGMNHASQFFQFVPVDGCVLTVTYDT